MSWLRELQYGLMYESKRRVSIWESTSRIVALSSSSVVEKFDLKTAVSSGMVVLRICDKFESVSSIRTF